MIFQTFYNNVAKCNHILANSFYCLFLTILKKRIPRFISDDFYLLHIKVLILRLSNVYEKMKRKSRGRASTVGINPVLSDLNTSQTSKLGWRYFEANKIDRNELQIHRNSQKGTGTKMPEKLNNFERFDKENQISALFSTQRPLDDWPDALDHLAIVLVANKYQKICKTWKNM
jgi:hypothetical protein